MSAEHTHSYFVVMRDFGRRGLEAIVDPEITRSGVIERLRSGEYKNVRFIHLITMNNAPEDLTEELMAEAGVLEAEFCAIHNRVNPTKSRTEHAVYDLLGLYSDEDRFEYCVVFWFDN